MKPKPIEVVPYNPAWPAMFEREAEKIKAALGKNCIAIHHIGSTSVPGLSAKPTIDIITVVRDGQDSITSLEAINYVYKGEMHIPFRFYFSKNLDTNVNLHLYEKDSPEIELNILFRNYLHTHPKARTEYSKLKEELLKQANIDQKNNLKFTNYTLGKDAFIRDILKKAGFNKLKFMYCTHHAEWEAAKRFRQKYFFDNVPITDPYTWTFNHTDHKHFILYQGVDIVGYAHIQLWPDAKATMHIIVIEESKRNNNLGNTLLKLCEKWLKTQGYKSLHAQSSPAALKFYRKHGYVNMPFNYPNRYETDPNDIPVGKIL